MTQYLLSLIYSTTLGNTAHALLLVISFVCLGIYYDYSKKNMLLLLSGNWQDSKEGLCPKQALSLAYVVMFCHSGEVVLPLHVCKTYQRCIDSSFGSVLVRP